jgi:hypothetical protein
VTVVVALLLHELLKGGRTVARVTLAISAAIAVGFVWLANIEGATRLVFLGMEIDRRVESATEILGRLEAIETSTTNSVERLAEVQRDAERAKGELSELIGKEARVFEIARLQGAAIDGDRAAYNTLKQFDSAEPELAQRARVAMMEVKRFYVGATKIKGVTLRRTRTEEQEIKEADFKTAWLLQDLAKNQAWPIRAKAAQLLGQRQEFGVPEALLNAMETDSNLWVAKEALDSFERITGFAASDVFQFEVEANSPSKWYEEHKKEVEPRLKSLDGSSS